MRPENTFAIAVCTALHILVAAAAQQHNATDAPYISSETSNVTVVTSYGQALRGVRTTDVTISVSFGLELEIETTTVDIYKGIAYALPPTGERRFMPPTPAKDTGHVTEVKTYGPSCPQYFKPAKPLTTDDAQQDEDCLYLNVFAPYNTLNVTRRYPVAVFIHGGSYEAGAGSDYDAELLAQMGVVFVTFNYRLGALGYLSSGDTRLPGNYGLLDQAAAIQWVAENIALFRGDADRVTLIGHSVGGASIGILMNMPRVHGYYHRVIMMSGFVSSVYSMSPKSDLEDYIYQVASILGCPEIDPFEDLMQCLRRLPWKRFKDLRTRFPGINEQGGIIPEFRPIVDDVVLNRDISKHFSNQMEIPVLLGTVEHEFSGAIPDKNLKKDIDKLLNIMTGADDLITKRYILDGYTDYNVNKVDYNDILNDILMYSPCGAMSELLSDGVAPVYQYHFNNSRSYHSFELNYLFGAPFSDRLVDENKSTKFNFKDAMFSKNIITIFKNFIYANPMQFDVSNNGDSVNANLTQAQQLLTYDVYDSTKRYYLDMNDGEFRMRQAYRYDKVKMLTGFVPEMAARFEALTSDLSTAAVLKSLRADSACLPANSAMLVALLIAVLTAVLTLQVYQAVATNRNVRAALKRHCQRRKRSSAAAFCSEETGLSNGAVELDIK